MITENRRKTSHSPAGLTGPTANPPGLTAVPPVLNARGIKPRRARHWTGGPIRTMLSNCTYAGRPCYNGKVSPKKKHRSRFHQQGEGRLERPDEALRVISDKVFNAVQAKMKGRKSLRPTGQNCTRKFSRLITCGVCGATFIRRYKAGGEKCAAWTCGTRVRIQESVPQPTLRQRGTARGPYRSHNAACHPGRRSHRPGSRCRGPQTRGGKLWRTPKGSRQHHRHQRRAWSSCRPPIDPDLSGLATKRLLSKQVAEKTAERERL